MNKYGYVRVSAKDQNPERQMMALKDCGIRRKDIYMDKWTGASFSRPAYQTMMGRLAQGDLLVVKSIDRLGRNYEEILEQWRTITKEIHADIQVLDMPLLNTRTEHENLTGVFVADLVLQILAYVAETERSFIRQRQAEGIAAAKANGVLLGRRRLEVPGEFVRYYQLWKSGEMTSREAAASLDMSHTTFYRRSREYEEGLECKKR